MLTNKTWKIFFGAAVFLFFIGAMECQGYGLVTLTGTVDGFFDLATDEEFLCSDGAPPFSYYVQCGDPVEIILYWSNDDLVPASGPGHVLFKRSEGMGNMMVLKLAGGVAGGGLTIEDSDKPDDNGIHYPEGWFCDTLLNKFEISWNMAAIQGASREEWSVEVYGEVAEGDTEITIELLDYYDSRYNLKGIRAHVDFPAGITPCLAGDSDADKDVDGVDLAYLAGNGGDLQVFAGNFGVVL